MIVDQHVDLIMGCAFSPDVTTVAPLSTQAKMPCSS